MYNKLFFLIPVVMLFCIASSVQAGPFGLGAVEDVTLGWRTGRQAAEHNVYLSTDEQSVTDGTAPVDVVTEARYSPSHLDLGATYYWRVDEVNVAETHTIWQGDVWDFTTQEYIVVDDFEAYNDLNPDDPESNRIFLTWTGGDADPANGSQVGHDTFPFNDIPTGDYWHWSQEVKSEDESGEPPVEFTLSAGTHNLEISYRGADLRIDAIVFSRTD